MATNTESAEKRIALDHLNYGKKTAQRAAWEAWEFTVTGPGEIEVTNASYGYLKDRHSYAVKVAQAGGLAVPQTCECRADQYNELYDCKHKVALATIGGPTVLDAALAVASVPPADKPPRETDNDGLRPDGGCNCDGRDFPCFECYLTDRRALS